MEHHEEAIRLAVTRYGGAPGVEAVVVVGSVARGEERPDSDVDLVLVVTPAEFARQEALDRVSVVEHHDLYADGGYFDLKHATLEQLDAAADHGDEPMRASFAGARIVGAADAATERRLAAVLTAMTDLDEAYWLAAERAFAAQARLHGRYFFGEAVRHGDVFLLHHAAAHYANAVARAVLARHRVLFAGPKYVEARLTAAGEPGLVARIRDLLAEPTPASRDALRDDFESRGWPITPEASLSQFVADNELAWLTGVIPPEYR